MSLIPGRGIGVREKIQATPSVGVGGEAHVCRNKRTDWSSSKKGNYEDRTSTLTLNVSSTFNSKDWESLKFLQLIIFNSLTQFFCIDRKYLLKRDSQIQIE